MLESFLSDFSFIKETLDKENDQNFFGREFSFFSTEPVLFYLADKDRIVYVNSQFTKEFNYTVDDISQWKYSIYPLLSAGEQDSFIQAIKTLLENDDESAPDASYRLSAKDKKPGYYRVKVRKLYKGYYFMQFEQSLENLVDYKTMMQETLEIKIEELNKSNRELEEFAYVASHDMQEPLRKISTFGNRLKTQLSDQLGEDGNLYLSRMLGASENMRNLIENLLEFSKVSRNKQPYECIDLNGILKEVMDDLDLRIAETNAKISIEPPLPQIEAIPSQMRQLFFNLLQNAIKFRKKDTTLVITVNNKKLGAREVKRYQLTAGRAYYMITVSDNGIGFEQQYAERIFQLFQRLEGKSEYPGTGIGLSICRKIVANHMGQIFAESVPAQGTVFTIILPEEQ